MGHYLERQFARPHYAHCVYQGANLASRLGYKKISVAEFGVGGGNGLVLLEQYASEVSAEFDIKIEVYGFDTGKGLPAPEGYKDLPYVWQAGYYEMDVDALRGRLKHAQLVLGDIRETSKTFFEQYRPAPLAAMFIDVDFYSSTVAALEIFNVDEKIWLPRIFCYFDDIIGDAIALYSDYTGQRLAISEFNESNATKKISPVYYLNAAVVPWARQMFILHDFAHSEYNVLVYRPDDGPIQLPLSGQKSARDRDLLLEEVERNPEDARSVFYLAQSYFDLGDFVNARKWYAQRAEMGGAEQEIYFAMFRIAASMEALGEPWPDVEDAYLKAWQFRPTRAEPLYAIAKKHRVDRNYRLGYPFAQRAAQIPFPRQDTVFVHAEVYGWLATDEQAICAFYIGKQAEAFTLCRRLLARSDIPNRDRQRIASNRDFSVPAMIEAASSYPDVLAGSLVAAPHDAQVTISLIAGPDRAGTEQTLNSFLHCCTDVSRVGRFLVVDTGLSAQDRAMLLERYGFLEFAHADTGDGPGDGRGVQLAHIRAQISGRFWLHLGQGWRFFAPENFVTRLTAVLDAETQVFQVGINFADAVNLTGTCAAEQEVRRAPDAGRYLLTDVVASGPAMFDTARLDQVSGGDSSDSEPITELVRQATAAGLQTASLDEVLCTTAI